MASEISSGRPVRPTGTLLAQPVYMAWRAASDMSV